MKNLSAKIALVVLLSGMGITTMRAGDEMTPAAKTISALAVGGLSGYIFGQVYNQSARAGGIVGGIALVAGLAYLRNGREDAVQKAFGSEYVGISAIAAVAGALATVQQK